MSKDYITPAGFKALQEEFSRLKTKERPEVTQVVAWAASNGDRSENADYHYGKRRLREIDRRLEFLTKRMDILEVVDPLTIKSAQVKFGATLKVIDENGDEQIYSLVGTDEIDVDRGRISWVSPVGKALMNKQVGDIVNFKTPKGERELEIVEISYIAL